MKIAIVGAGFFGTAIALRFSKKHFVHLYEKESDILKGASEANQFRYHLGYHYPRSISTISEIQEAHEFNSKNGYFKKFLKKNLNYYGVNKRLSKVSFSKYISILKKKNIFFKKFKNIIKGSECKNFIQSKETNLNYFKYKNFIKKELSRSSNIKLKLNSEIDKKDILNYDKVIICTYSNINNILKKIGIKKLLKFKYELIEKLIVRLPKKFKNISYVILDGKFANLDPYEGTKNHLLSDVLNSKLEIKKSKFPTFKDSRKKYLNKGLVRTPESTFKRVVKRCSKYFPFLENSKYVYSIYSIRTIKRESNNDDRNSEIININKKVCVVFSGKWMSCYYIANKLYKFLNP